MLNNATAIDNNGDIAGYGTDAAGNTYQAFVILQALLPGDANLDGKVDINDLTIVLAHYSQTGMTWTTGEFTGDGTVDINDLTIVLAHYNQSIGASAGGSFRPCPSRQAWFWLASALLALLGLHLAKLSKLGFGHFGRLCNDLALFPNRVVPGVFDVFLCRDRAGGLFYRHQRHGAA